MAEISENLPEVNLNDAAAPASLQLSSTGMQEL